MSSLITADAEMARRAGVFKPDGTPNAEWFRNQRRERKLTWHHNQDRETLQLVPRDLNANIPHTGGASGARAKP